MYGAIATVIVEYAKTDTTAEALRWVAFPHIVADFIAYVSPWGRWMLNARFSVVLRSFCFGDALCVWFLCATNPSGRKNSRALDESGIPTARIQLFAKLYNDNSKRLRDVASQTGMCSCCCVLFWGLLCVDAVGLFRSTLPPTCIQGFDLPNLAGVNWRLDYHIRSSNTGSANAPLYLVPCTFIGLALNHLLL
jgi:hypothetical protein